MRNCAHFSTNNKPCGKRRRNGGFSAFITARIVHSFLNGKGYNEFGRSNVICNLLTPANKIHVNDRHILFFTTNSYPYQSSRCGQMVCNTVLGTWMVMGSSPKPPPMLVDTLSSFKSASITPLVNLRITQTACMQRIHPGFETQGRRHQKSKSGVSVSP